MAERVKVCRGGRFRRGSQGDIRELAVLRGFRIGLDESAVAFGNGEHGGEAEPGALADFFGCEKWIRFFR